MFPLHQNLQFSPQDFTGGAFTAMRPDDAGMMRATGGPLAAGDFVQYAAQGRHDGVLAAPPSVEGGRWQFVGSQPGGPQAMGASQGPNDYNPTYGNDPAMQTWQWVADQPAPQQEAPQEPGQQQAIPARLPIYDNSPGGWDQYMDFARAETEGLNRMPFVYGVGPNTGTRFLTDDPAQQFQTFYPSNLQGWQEYLRNPMFEGDAPPAAIGDAGTSAPRSRNPWDFTDTNWTNPIFR